MRTTEIIIKSRFSGLAFTVSKHKMKRESKNE